MKKEDIIKELKTVYDPEMPSIDVFTLGLIYDKEVNLCDFNLKPFYLKNISLTQLFILQLKVM